MFDTNVLLAAFGTRGLCEALLDVCLGSHHLMISEHIIAEVRRHLTGKFKMPDTQAESIIAFLREHTELVTPAEVPDDAFTDADDLPVLGTALAAQADCLVTGDRELQALGQFHQIPILSPRAFYERLR